MPESTAPTFFNSESIVDTVREPMLVLNADLRVRRANRSFYRTFKVTPQETVDRLVYDLGNQQWDIPWLRKLLEEVLPQDTAFDDFEVEHFFPVIGRKFMRLNARRICGKNDQTEFILLAIEDATESHQAEDARREVESRYTSLVQNIKDHAIFMMDLEGNITTWNAEAEKIIGYDEAEIFGRNFSVIFTAEDLQKGMSEKELRLARENGRAEDERWHMRKDGSRFWALGIVTPMRDASGNHIGFSKILRDMTDRKRAEEALQRAHEAVEAQVRTRTAELRRTNEELQKEIEDRKLAERRLNAQHATTKAIAESPNLGAAVPQILETVCQSMGWVGAAVWMVNAQTQTLGLAQSWHSPSVNLDEFLAVCREKAFSHGEILPGRAWAAGELAWVPDLKQDEDFRRKHLPAQAGLRGAFAAPIRVSQEVIGVIEFFSKRIEQLDEKIVGMMTAIGSQIGQFIEKTQTAAALDKEREFLKAVLENAQDLIVACDAHGELAIVNRAARELHGATIQPLPAEKWSKHFDLYHPDGMSLLTKDETPLYRALHGENVRDVEIVIRPKEGPAHTMLASGQAITDAAGQMQGAVVVMHDVTERNLLEKQLRQSQKMEAFGQLAGGVAHDFNNMLTVISGYSEIVIAALPPDDHRRGPIEQIYRAGERAALLTRQLLAFSRKQLVEPKVLELNPVVASTEKMLRRLIGEDMVLRSILQPGLDRVKVDPGQVEQVIMNLVVNARDAMPQGGTITIETSNVDLDENYGQNHAEVMPGRYVLLAVSDTGCGMTEEIKRHAFEPFFTTKEPGKGTGLGLATVYGIVKQSGGHIWLYSEVGLGTTFKVYFPSVGESAAADEKQRSVPAPQSGTETIVLVEDDDQVRSLAQFALQSFGYTILEARNGNAAVQLCATHKGRVDLLVTDVVMPGMSGRQVAEAVTALKPTIKVLYLSGYTDDALVRHGVLQAETAFLQKPFTTVALARKVRELLDR